MPYRQTPDRPGMPEFVVESLIDGRLAPADDWDSAWSLARWLFCAGGSPEGNVRVHETTSLDPSTFYSEFAPGRRMTARDWAKVKRATGRA